MPANSRWDLIQGLKCQINIAAIIRPAHNVLFGSYRVSSLE